MRKVTIYTDGACSPNPGSGGWAAILRDETTGRYRELFGGAESVTNNIMELTAAIEGLKALNQPCEVELYTDSQYLIGGMSGNKRKKNRELFKQLDELCKIHSVQWKYVPGHEGFAENERADTLAVRGRYGL